MNCVDGLILVCVEVTVLLNINGSTAMLLPGLVIILIAY